MITLEDWALIRRLAADGVPKARIAARLGISRTTVVKAVQSTAPPKYERRAAPTSFTPFEAQVRALLAAEPDMPATVIAERVGWTGSISWFRKNVKRLRCEQRRIDPADRITWEPGGAAQCDLWFPPRKIPLEDGSARLLPVLVITAAHSRYLCARMIPTRKTEDLLLGSWELIRQLGGVPRRLIWDNEPGIGRGRRHADGVTAFTGTLATKLVLLRPHDPESKGLVERRNRWLETSFIPGRTFASPADFNSQLADWLARANTRIVRTTKAAPIELLDADRAAMLPLPPVPLHLGWRNRIRLGRDYYVRVDTCDYSVDPTAIGRIVEVIGDLEQVRVRLDGRLIAEHRRCWARQMTVTDPAHVTTAAALRNQFRRPRPGTDTDADLVRDLADYDRAFGLVDGGQAS
ncbi:transposase [Rhodococcus rhodochrous J45]|uniref:Transposase n=1 Tax=Rhodococcus rhodochrous J45 TaxID=935266 RepID=A0A562DKH8_RHORH|nr:IS21 family transposase [Rhodococcus rhodochrous]TWH10095.1 transposase [Rhodococcus rhodochrous J45]